MNKKAEAPADPMAEKRASYDHETGTYSEPKPGDNPKTVRHQVDPRLDRATEDSQNPNGPVPRRADPFAHQRDEKAAKAEAAKGEKASAKEEKSKK